MTISSSYDNNKEIDCIKSIKSPLLIGFAFAFLSIILSGQVYAQQQQQPPQPTVIVSPPCGATSGFSLVFNANGFTPNGNVHWQVHRPTGEQTYGPYGYFATNATGGFLEPTGIEEGVEPGTEVIPPGTYVLQFFDDLNLDGRADPGAKRTNAMVKVPC
ncbi:MAG: hypothetical protein M3227_03370 [Thermoproteota archaeon]|nr:hypothetical protein [Thermoproteota archaeon]